MARIISTLLSFTFVLMSTAVLATEVERHGRLDLQAGHLEHPLGLADDEAAAYAQGRLQYELNLIGARHRVDVTYDGTMTRFEDPASLGYSRHAVGLEFVRTAPHRTDTVWGAGLQAALRSQDDLYAIYDHEEFQGYITAKGYPLTRLMLRGNAGVRTRSYGALPEESFREPYLTLESKYFSPSRTTIGATLRLGGKWFHDPVAPRVWGTRDMPVTAQLAAALNLSQSVSERVGVRASLQHRTSLADFPYFVSEDIYDSPLLDRYARSGWAAGGSVKVLSVEQIWLRVGFDWRQDDYGAIRFLDADGSTRLREDTTTATWLELERTLSVGGRRLVLSGQVAWTERSSNLSAYTWSGPSAGGGVSWRWR